MDLDPPKSRTWLNKATAAPRMNPASRLARLAPQGRPLKPEGLSKGHTNIVTSVAIASDGTRVVSGSHEKTIHLWDLCKA